MKYLSIDSLTERDGLVAVQIALTTPEVIKVIVTMERVRSRAS